MKWNWAISFNHIKHTDKARQGKARLDRSVQHFTFPHARPSHHQTLFLEWRLTSILVWSPPRSPTSCGRAWVRTRSRRWRENGWMTRTLLRREKDIGELTVRAPAKVDNQTLIRWLRPHCVVSRPFPRAALPSGRNHHHHHLLCDEGQRWVPCRDVLDLLRSWDCNSQFRNRRQHWSLCPGKI